MQEPPNRNQQLERPLPHSPQAERAVLGAVILDNTIIFEAIDLLEPEDFYLPSHRGIFAAMIVLFERGSEINPILIGEEIKRDGALESVGGISFIVDLTYGLPHFSSISQFAKVIKDHALMRQLVKVGSKIVSDALEGDDLPTEVLARSEAAVFALSRTRHKTKLKNVTEEMGAAMASSATQPAHGVVEGALETGFTDLDGITSGFQRGDLIIIAARPSMGKTSLAQSLVNNIGIRGGKVCAFFSLEMSENSLATRMICSEARVDFTRFRRGTMNHEEWDRINEAKLAFDASRIFVDDTAAISVLEARAKCMRLASEEGQLDTAVFDYLQLMTAAKRENRQQEVTQISRDLKGLAKELNVPIIALSQLSRAPETRNEHRPMLSDLRESGAIEQDADVVAFIYRESRYQSGLSPENQHTAEIILGKQRNGPTGTIMLRFEDRYTRFDSLQLDI